MVLGELNFMIFIFFFLFMTISININTSLHLLLTAELLWITIYSLSAIIGFLYDNVNFLSLTFFFLVLSAVEFGIGLIIITSQNIYNRTISLNSNSINNFKFSNRLLKNFNINFFKFF